jgi:hypothetical protein
MYTLITLINDCGSKIAKNQPGDAYLTKIQNSDFFLLLTRAAEWITCTLLHERNYRRTIVKFTDVLKVENLELIIRMVNTNKGVLMKTRKRIQDLRRSFQDISSFDGRQSSSFYR